ncbi:hypothetical protein MMC13_005376 [Lambiella insularis]|nr:hypothetical protein [Lambiella insularis]
MATKEELAKLCEMDLELKEFLASEPQPEPISEDIVVFRKISQQIEDAEVQKLGPVSAKVKEAWSSIPMHDGFQNKCKVFQPANPPPEGSPLVVLLHGGGFAVGSPDQYTALCRALVEIFGAVCIAPSYRLVPEHAFPTSAIDAWDTLQFLAANAEATYGANLDRGFVVGGASSGGNLAAVVTQLAKDRGLCPPLTGQYLSIPLIMWEETVPSKYRSIYHSLEQNAEAPIHPTSSLKAVLARYNPDIHSPYFSPLNSKSGQSELPPTYIQACGLDCIRDDALIYSKILKEHGVKTKLDLYPGFPHGWWLFMPTLNSSLNAVADILKGIGWLLGTEVDDDTAVSQFRGKIRPLVVQ